MDLILFLMQYNTDTQFIESGEAVKAAVFYITEYITKGSLPMYIGIQALEYATKMHEQKFESLEDVTVYQKNRNLINKFVNAMMGQQEISHQQVMSYLVGGGDFYVSHTFQTVRWYEFVQAADRLDREMMDDENEERYGESEDSPIQEEQVTVNITADGVEVTSDIEDYTLRPITECQFADLSLWEFVEKTIKEQDDKPLEESVDTEDSDSDIASVILLKKCGRKRLLRAKFAEQHSQYGSHRLCMHNKAVVPVLLGEAISGKDGGEKEYENYCRCMIILFKPWCNLKCLKGGYKTWMEAFESEVFPADVAAKRNVKKHMMHMLHYGALDGDGHVNMAEFDEALFADSALDSDGEMDELVESKSHVQSIVEVDKHAGDIQTCLCVASDGGTADTEVKHARLAETEDELSISLQQMEEDAEITSVYYKPEITDHQRESILTEIIDEFKLSDNAEQEMCLRIIGEHFIHGDVKQLLMFITGIGGSGKSHVI
ncbi:hypothetical protein BD769DRAFT_1392699 [Suillus cothurnatus]|nr:hypothetical protein BD769DRAFT_1392699 [Suillus cothurnatus]